MPDVKPTFQGETQFLAWGDGPSGPWVKLLLPDSDDLGPFRGMTAAKKAMAGQRLACVLVEIGDQEQAIEPAVEAPKGGALARLAGVLCGDAAFRLWMATCGGTRECDAPCTEEEAAQIMREECGIGSRAELDHDPAAAEIFHERYRKPWNAKINGGRA